MKIFLFTFGTDPIINARENIIVGQGATPNNRFSDKDDRSYIQSYLLIFSFVIFNFGGLWKLKLSEVF